MLSSSKLVLEAAAKQEQAVAEALSFSDPLQQAMALADHFEKIQAEEYIIPETGGFARTRNEHPFSTDCYTSL